MTIKLEPVPSAAARYMSDGQMSLVHAADRLARERFAECAATYDAAAEFPTENYVDLNQAGLLTLRNPTVYGDTVVDRFPGHAASGRSRDRFPGNAIASGRLSAGNVRSLRL